MASSLLPSAGSHAARDGVSMVTPHWLAQHLGVNPRFATGFQGFGQLPGSVALAVNAVASGAADHVLVHRALHNPPGRYHGNSRTQAAGPDQWTSPQGFFGPLTMIGMMANEYVQRFGASREALAAVVVEARKNGSRIPWSYWHDRPLTVEEYLAAPMISDPISRFDCDIPVDGVATFVLTTAERARDLPHRPVYVAGYASGSPRRGRLHLHWPLDDVLEVGLEVGRRLWASAGVGSGARWTSRSSTTGSPRSSGCGWRCWASARSAKVIGSCSRAGSTAMRPGGLPALSSGGALGNGRMHGVPQMLECYLQLSGRAGERQRPGARVGVACHSSPHFGGAIVYSAEPL